MLRKLLKYDLKANFKFMLIFYSLALLFAALTRLCFAHADTLVVQILAYVFNGATIAMIANIVINNLMRLWIYFKRNLYSDEGYLTHTLPVRRADLFTAKFLMGLITMVVSIVVILATLAIAYLTPENFEALRTWLVPMTEAMDSTIIKTMFAIIVLVAMEIFAIILAGFMGIILGYRKLTNHTGWSVMFGFVCYLGMQQITGIGIAILAATNTDVRNSLFTSDIMPDLGVLKPMLVTAIVCYTIDIVAGYLLSQKWFQEIDLD